jgi:hypothetical protein
MTSASLPRDPSDKVRVGIILRKAKALGLTILHNLSVAADDVIE